MPYRESKPECSDCTALRLEIKGLRGGHSGMEIVLQRANANKLLFRFLRPAMKKYGLQLASVDGGGLRNAIPREASAVIVVPAKDRDALLSDLKEFERTVITEYKGIEDGISVKASQETVPGSVMENQTAVKLANAVCGCPNGVISMSRSMPGLVQTSSNLARVVSDNGEIKIQCLMRSSVNSEKEDLGENISAVMELAGAEVELSGGYDGWNPNMESPILKAMIKGYEKLYGKKPEVTAIHAGLECGIIGGAYPNLDMISFGPTIRYPHSPDEEVNIASVGKFWDFLKATLADAPEK